MPETPRPSTPVAPSSDVNRSGELEVLVLVAERGSLSAAARQLSISPSAVSKTMSRLEARLGVQLLRRTTRRLSLTDSGREYVEQAGAACEQILAAALTALGV